MLRLAILPLVFLCTQTVTSAQTYVADPIDNDASALGNLVPLAASTSYDESRVHHFFPAAYLPGTGGLITDIEFAMQSAVTVPYQLLEFSLDHTTNPTLSTTFASNLTNPVIVYSLTNASISYPSTWYKFTLQTPFTYDGSRNLILETRKIADRTLTPVGSAATRVQFHPVRTDTVPPVWAYGPFGSGQSSAAVANLTYVSEVLIRLHFANSPTLTIDSTRSGNRSYYHVGATITLVNMGAPSARYATFLEASVFPWGISIPGLGGELWLSSLDYVVDGGWLDALGCSSFSATIPSDPTLVGLPAHLQSLIVSGTVDFTNVVKAPLAAY